MRRRLRVPGRVELVGKHTDYGGGPSLTCAVDLALTVEVEPLMEPVLRLQSDLRPDAIEMSLATPETPHPGHWSAYAAAVVRRLRRDFPSLTRGVALRLRSTLPADAGLSSSSAFVIAVAESLVERNELTLDPRWRALIPDTLAKADYYAALETGAPFRTFPGDEGVGVAGGAQDHVAILCAQRGQCGLFRYLPARLEQSVPWPNGRRIAIAVSGVRASKADNAREQYNRTAHALRALFARWRADNANTLRSLSAVLDEHPQAAAVFQALASAGLDGLPGAYLEPRWQQFLQESRDIVPAAAAALARGDRVAFGQCVDRSQAGAEAGLANQVPETRYLAQQARRTGAEASSAFGAGFGGAVWAMVPADRAEDYLLRWQQAYARAFAHRMDDAQFLLTDPGEPAGWLDTR